MIIINGFQKVLLKVVKTCIGENNKTIYYGDGFYKKNFKMKVKQN